MGGRNGQKKAVEFSTEENLLFKVSVKSDVPVISDKTSKWMPALPEVSRDSLN